MEEEEFIEINFTKKKHKPLKYGKGMLKKHLTNTGYTNTTYVYQNVQPLPFAAESLPLTTEQYTKLLFEDWQHLAGIKEIENARKYAD